MFDMAGASLPVAMLRNLFSSRFRRLRCASIDLRHHAAAFYPCRPQDGAQRRRGLSSRASRWKSNPDPCSQGRERWLASPRRTRIWLLLIALRSDRHPKNHGEFFYSGRSRDVRRLGPCRPAASVASRRAPGGRCAHARPAVLPDGQARRRGESQDRGLEQHLVSGGYSPCRRIAKRLCRRKRSGGPGRHGPGPIPVLSRARLLLFAQMRRLQRRPSPLATIGLCRSRRRSVGVVRCCLQVRPGPRVTTGSPGTSAP